jgi:hypothetical protein
MKSKVFNLFLTVLWLNSISLQAETLSDDQLVALSKSAFEAWRTVNTDDDKIQAIRKGFENLTDSQKIRALTGYIFDLDSKSDDMFAWTANSVTTVLREDPTLIQDETELRIILKKETSARKFYLLSGFASVLSKQLKTDFISEAAPMLFRDDEVAKPTKQFNPDYLHDVSITAYTLIVVNLHTLNSDFERLEKKVPHHEKVLILAAWLKKNWPGCQNLEISERLKSSEKRQDRKRRETQSLSLPTDNVSKENIVPTTIAQNASEKIQMLLIFGGVILSMIIFFLIWVVTKSKLKHE